MAEPLLHPITEAARLLSIGRTRAFELVGRGELESVRVGRRRLVPDAALTDYVERLRAEQSEHNAS